MIASTVSDMNNKENNGKITSLCVHGNWVYFYVAPWL